MASSKEYLDFILEQLSDRGFLKELPEVMYEELPALKKKAIIRPPGLIINTIFKESTV